LRACHL